MIFVRELSLCTRNACTSLQLLEYLGKWEEKRQSERGNEIAGKKAEKQKNTSRNEPRGKQLNERKDGQYLEPWSQLGQGLGNRLTGFPSGVLGYVLHS